MNLDTLMLIWVAIQVPVFIGMMLSLAYRGVGKDPKELDSDDFQISLLVALGWPIGLICLISYGIYLVIMKSLNAFIRWFFKTII